MRRSARSGKVYDLFKFILHFENELSKSQYENSMSGDAYFPYLVEWLCTKRYYCRNSVAIIWKLVLFHFG
jgi:hypothetical protein